MHARRNAPAGGHHDVTVLSAQGSGIGRPPNAGAVGGSLGDSNDHDDFANFKSDWLVVESGSKCPNRKCQIAICSMWLWRMTRIQCGRWAHRQDVDDFTSFTMIAICEKIKRGVVVYDSSRAGTFRGWWVVIIQRAAWTVMRRYRSTDQSELDEETPDRRAAPVASEHELMSAIRRLPKRQKVVVTQSFLEKLTQQQIAYRLGVSKKTVQRALACGLAELRRQFGAE